MKNIITYFCIVIALLNSPQLVSSNQYIEEVNLTTDRNFYISGENIQFNALILLNGKYQKDVLSKVLYLELITPSGLSIAKYKYLGSNNFSGNFRIPSNLSSGIYYLKSYTKFMRNFGVSSYSYTIVKIVNPFKSELLNIETTSKEDIQTKIDSLQSLTDLIDIKIQRTSLKTNEKTSVNLTIDKSLVNNLSQTIISVVPENLWVNTITEKIVENSDKEFYKPETSGISISGKTFSSSSKKPIKNQRVNLSILEENDIITQISDSTGTFNFGFLNYYGDKDIFISSYDSHKDSSELQIDNDFCNKKVNIKAFPFSLNNNEREIALNMIQNLQVDSIFNNIDSTINNDTTNEPFYGIPKKTVFFDNYVLLPTIEEYFTEFIKDVAIRKKNGKRYFKVFGEEYALNTSPPLVMIDYVAIDDYEQLLTLNPQNISRIDVISKPYVKGNITYGGIISFISKKNNFAGINLPSSGLFLKFSFYVRNDQKVYTLEQNANKPDIRNTLLWKVILNNECEKDFDFLTGDTPGRYCIVVKSIDKNGKVYLSSKHIDILE